MFVYKLGKQDANYYDCAQCAYGHDGIEISKQCNRDSESEVAVSLGGRKRTAVDMEAINKTRLPLFDFLFSLTL